MFTNGLILRYQKSHQNVKLFGKLVLEKLFSFACGLIFCSFFSVSLVGGLTSRMLA